MCGLFGVHSSVLSKDEVNKAMSLGLLSMFRGTDSTGLALAYGNTESRKKRRPVVYDGFKHPIDSYGFLQMTKTEELLTKDLEKLCVMGHTRYSTSGNATSVSHAHPHRFKHIVGCHNGTIFRFNYKTDSKKLGTDSRVLFNMIAEDGIDEALNEADWGAYAISYYDTKANTISFARNRDRPLWFMETKAGSTIYWASEKRMLDFIAAGSQTFDDPYEIDVKKLYTWPIGEPRQLTTRPLKVSSYNFSSIPPYVQNRITYARKRRHNHYQGGEVLWPSLYHDPNKYEKDNDLYAYHSSEDKEADKWKDFKYLGYESAALSPQEVLLLLDQGCAFCLQTKAIEDSVYWTNADEWVCEKCTGIPFIRDFYNGGREFDPSCLGRVVRIEPAEDK